MTTADDNARRRSVLVWRLAALLALITIVLFARSLPYEFVAYDDDTFVYDNPVVKQGLTWKGVRYAFAIHGPSQYHPIAYISHMTDVSLFGLEHPAGHRAHSILAHAASAALLLLLLHRITGSVWRSAFVAAVFALHPLRVESVVWIAERKDITCMLLMLLTLHAYVSYARASGRRRAAWYAGVVVLYAMSLLSKPMAVTLPGVMWLLDYWPLRRLPKPFAPLGDGGSPSAPPVSWRRVFAEKVPPLALAGVSAWLTMLCQRDAGAVTSFDAVPLSSRVANALVSIVAYPEKLFWPMDLAVLYPLPREPDWVTASLGAAVLLIVTAIAFAQARRRPVMVVGWLWYLGTLLPVIGFVQVGVQAMADRYTYLPLIGLTVAIVWLLAELETRTRAAARSAEERRRSLRPVAVLVLFAYAVATWRQLPHWRDSEALFQKAVDSTGPNPVMEFNLGNALAAKREYVKAELHLSRAVALDPRKAIYANNWGKVLTQLKRSAEAAPVFRRAIELDPNHPSARTNLGVALLESGDVSGAIEAFDAALMRRPESPEARRGLSIGHNHLGTKLAREGRMREAAAHFEAALRADAGNADASANLVRAREAIATQPAPR